MLLSTCFEKPCSRALSLNWSTPTCGRHNFARGEGSERVHWNLSTPPYLNVFFPKTPLRFPSEHACRQSPLPSHIALVSLCKGKTRPSSIPNTDLKCKAFLNIKQMFQSSTPLLIRAPEVSLPIFAVDAFLLVCVLVAVISSSATPWTGARQALLSTGFSRQGYWSLLQGIFLNQGLNLGLLYCRPIL